MENAYTSLIKVTDLSSLSLMNIACRNAIDRGGTYTLTAKYSKEVGSVIEYKIYIPINGKCK